MSDLAAMSFVRALQERGARVYTVGGTIRDSLLGHLRKDIDLLVTEIPQNALIRLLRAHGRVQLTGRAFGVLKFVPRRWDGPAIDIALPRTEVSTGVGHRDFSVTFDHTLPVATDLGRRDFTINAMARDLSDGQLIDPFGGRLDLQQRLLRQVSGSAFPEDPLRMLRGVQLATRFDLRVTSETYEAMCTHAASITTVAAERIAEELRKLFQAARPSRGFLLMLHTGLLHHIMPDIARLAALPDTPRVFDLAPGQASADVFGRTMRRLDALRQHEAMRFHDHIDLLLAALWLESGLPEAMQSQAHPTPQQIAPLSARLARQRLETLRVTMTGAHLRTITSLIAHSAFELSALTTLAGLRHLAHQVGPELACMLFDLRLADRLGRSPDRPLDDLLEFRRRLQAELDRQVPLRLNDLALNGHDLQRLGIPPGRRIGQILEALLHRVLDDPACNTRVALLSMVRSEFLDGGKTSGPEASCL